MSLRHFTPISMFQVLTRFGLTTFVICHFSFHFISLISFHFSISIYFQHAVFIRLLSSSAWSWPTKQRKDQYVCDSLQCIQTSTRSLVFKGVEKYNDTVLPVYVNAEKIWIQTRVWQLTVVWCPAQLCLKRWLLALPHSTLKEARVDIPYKSSEITLCSINLSRSKQSVKFGLISKYSLLFFPAWTWFQDREVSFWALCTFGRCLFLTMYRQVTSKSTYFIIWKKIYMIRAS